MLWAPSLQESASACGTCDGDVLVLSGGYSADHPVIRVFWRVVEGFTDEEKRKLLKFVTSCSRPPLLGFKVGPLRVCSESPGGGEAAGQPVGSKAAGRRVSWEVT